MSCVLRTKPASLMGPALLLCLKIKMVSLDISLSKYLFPYLSKYFKVQYFFFYKFSKNMSSLT